jgi:S1-C subfamily serine protease
MLKYFLIALVAVLPGACAHSAPTAFVTVVGKNQLSAATGDCLMGATVLLSDATGQFTDDSPRGISVGGGYVITDAQVPLAQSRLIAAFTRDSAADFMRATAQVVTVDEGADIALLRINGEPACDAVLADMSQVRAGDDARLAILDGINRGTVIEPRQPGMEPGELNAVMRLSESMNDSPPGSGVYAADGTLIGMIVSDPADPGKPVALPADRIARFLRKYGVSYMRYDAAQQNDGLTIRADR